MTSFDNGAVEFSGHIQRIDLARVTDLAAERRLSEMMDYCGKEASDGITLEICLEARGHKRPCPFTISNDISVNGVGIGLEIGIGGDAA